MYRSYGYGMWLVSVKETGRIIGRAGLEHRDFHGETEVEIGYMIASGFWHQGYAMEVCEAILAFFDAELDFERLNCFIEEGNTPSIKVAKKLGFLYEETIVERGRNMLRFVKK